MPIIIPDDLPYSPRGIECLRFGARRGGTGIGCCAVDVMQGFSNAPDAICPPVPQFNGDSWCPEYDNDGEQICIGGPGITNEQAFLAYLVHGSFTPHEVAYDHAFIVIMTEEQIYSSTGKAWLQILRREGFEWKGSVNNSVYSEYHPNHIFMLIRNTHSIMEADEIEELKKPPQYWEELPAPSQTPEERLEILKKSYKEARTGLCPA